MKCLVLGGGGFIGSHLCDALLSNGHDVYIYQRNAPEKVIGSSPLLNKPKIVLGNFSTQSDFGPIVDGMDVIFHLISTTVPKQSNEDIIFDLMSNVTPTLRLLEAAKVANVQKIIYASSGGTVYGVPERLPIDEEHVKRPTSAYGIHKIMVEKYLDLYKQLYGLDYSVMRISNPYGEGQRATKGQGVIAAFLERVFNGQPIEIWGDGSTVRDYLHVSDVAQAALRLMEYKGSHSVFNVGSGKGISLRMLVSLIEVSLGETLDVRYLPGRSFDVSANVLDITRAREELGWLPLVDIQTGLHRTVDYFLNLSR